MKRVRRVRSVKRVRRAGTIVWVAGRGIAS
jgi:hypothetical protein